MEEIDQRFWSQVSKTTSCWNWTGRFGKSGQPIFTYKSREHSARLYSLSLVGLNAASTKPKVTCGNKSCVNPDHLLFGTEARFWSKVQKTDTCWIWIGGRNDEGYGKFTIESGNTVGAHRYSYQLKSGSIPDEMMICHKCDNPSCVNFEHLYLGTAKDNSYDRDSRGRANTPVGSRNSLSHLNETAVTDIRNQIPFDEVLVKIQKLANQYGVKEGTILDVLIRRSWQHI